MYEIVVIQTTMVGKYRHRIHGKGRVRIPKGMRYVDLNCNIIMYFSILRKETFDYSSN